VQSVLRTLAQTDVRDLLPQVAVPATVLHRTGDRAVRIDAGRYVARGIPGARFVELPGAEHWWWLGDATPIVEAIEAHVRRARR
jgi:pimeloyl-ACP methyl ester carboxylesterase